MSKLIPDWLWLDYDLSDFLLFSPRVYARMFELQNGAIWPLHILAFLVSAMLIWGLWRGKAKLTRFSFFAFALIWAGVGFLFLYQRYASINPYAVYGAYAFGLQAVLLIVASFSKPSKKANGDALITNLFTAMLILILCAYPTIGYYFTNSWMQTQWVGIAPDPTALFTIGLVFMMGWRRFWYLAVIPFLWIFASSLTLYTLALPQWTVMPNVVISLVVLLLFEKVLRSSIISK